MVGVKSLPLCLTSSWNVSDGRSCNCMACAHDTTQQITVQLTRSRSPPLLCSGLSTYGLGELRQDLVEVDERLDQSLGAQKRNGRRHDRREHLQQQLLDIITKERKRTARVRVGVTPAKEESLARDGSRRGTHVELLAALAHQQPGSRGQPCGPVFALILALVVLLILLLVCPYVMCACATVRWYVLRGQ